MRAVKIPREQRIFLIDPGRVTPFRVFRAMHLTRWAGQLPAGGVLTPAGPGRWSLAAGGCGHFSFFKWRVLLHRHPGGRPVPGDLKAALRGETPIPEWFLQGRAPEEDPR